MKAPPMPLGGRIAIVIGLLLMVLVLALAGCATSAPSDDGAMHVTIKAERVAQCKEQGGCALLSRDQVLEMLNEAVQAGAKAAMEDLDTNGCRRGAI